MGISKNPEYYSMKNDYHSEIISKETLCWENISVWKKRPKKRGVFRKTTYEDVRLLDDVSGFANSGSLVALMGSSGSGKTTLLASISRRLTEGVHGNIYMNGEVMKRSQMIRISGFVPQSYLTMDYFTVYEHISFMARLKMDKRTPEIERLRKISQLLNQFGLDSSSSTYLCRLSGGERKRLSIAAEMLTDPRILFCDEPTTGLDSWNASSVICTLRKFCSQGKIVICSIHQPASGIFDLFDDVILLATGGRTAYFGPANEAVEYFANLRYLCPPSYNIAEFLLNIVSISPKRDRQQVKKLCDSYAASDQATKVKNDINSFLSVEKISSNSTNSSTDSDMFTHTKSIKHVGVFTQTYLLTCRTFKNYLRNYKSNIIPFIVFSYMAFISSTLFGHILYSRDQSRWQNISGFLSVFVLDACNHPAYIALTTTDKQLSSREIGAGLYTAEARYLCVLICKTSHAIIASILYIVIIKNITDCFDYLSYLELIIILYVSVASAMSIGCMLSAIYNDLMVSITVLNIYLSLSQLTGGIYSNLSGNTIFAKIIKYFSTMFYAGQAIMVLEWKTIDIEEMKQHNISSNDPAAFYNLKTLAQQGYGTYNYKYNLYVLTASTILCHFIAYVLIAKKSKKQAVY